MKIKETYETARTSLMGLTAISLSVIMPLIYIIAISEIAISENELWALWVFGAVGIFGLILAIIKGRKVCKLENELKFK